jgi:formate dehydrogenase iron-sulfur subunit
MDKCTFCAGGPEEADNSPEEFRKYGSNRIAEGKLPLCAEMCSTKALLAGDANIVADIYRKRVVNRAASALVSSSSLQQTGFQPTVVPPELEGKATATE